MKAAAQHSTNKFGSAFTLHFICIVEKKIDIRSLPTAKNFFARHSTNEFGSALTHSFFDLLIQNSSLGWSGYILEFWYSHIVLLIVFVSISRHSDAKAWPPVRVASFSQRISFHISNTLLFIN
jgi:hypothetical protein